MEKATVRILVVDDYEAWRRFVSTTLQTQPELQIIGEATNGLEAVQKAQKLQPNLILLDIGLPLLNGIEAARRIRELSPKSTILFLSENQSGEVAGEALRTDGSGYVVKSRASSELLLAVKAVLRGERFVSASLASHLAGAASERAADAASRRNNILAWRPQSVPPKAETARRHEVGFYSEDRFLLEDVEQFIGAALKAGDAAIVVATASHRDSLLSGLQSPGLDIGAAVEQGRYIALDAADNLSRLMFKGIPDPVRFLKLWGNLIVTAAEATKKEQARVAIFGECVHLLWVQGHVEAAIQLERLGNQLVKAHAIDILCGYSLGSIRGGVDDDALHRICSEHSAVHSR